MECTYVRSVVGALENTLMMMMMVMMYKDRNLSMRLVYGHRTNLV